VRRPAANGTISNRQWQDIRQAARMTRSEGLKSITLHGVVVSGFPRDLKQQQRSPQQPQQQKKESHTVPDEGTAQSMETSDCATPVKSTKMLQRDAQRLKEFQGRLIAKRWGHLAFKFHYTVVWRNWLSTRQAARRKLRAGLWREWTRPQFDSESWAPGGWTLAGRLSHRDVYIRDRANTLCSYLSRDPLVEILPRGSAGSSSGTNVRMIDAKGDKAKASWEEWDRRDADELEQDELELERAIAASLEPQAPPSADAEAQPPASTVPPGDFEESAELEQAMAVSTPRKAALAGGSLFGRLLGGGGEQGGGNDMQQAESAGNVEDACGAGKPGADRVAAGKASRSEAGVPATPGSARPSKRRGRKRWKDLQVGAL
jgi:hypothetical protein